MISSLLSAFILTASAFSPIQPGDTALFAAQAVESCPLRVIKSGAAGGSRAKHQYDSSAKPGVSISSIDFYIGSRLDKFKITYSDGSSELCGDPASKAPIRTFAIPANDRLKSIEVHHDGRTVIGVALTTQQGRSRSFMGTRRVTAQQFFGGQEIRGFHGGYGRLIDSMGVYYVQ